MSTAAGQPRREKSKLAHNPQTPRPGQQRATVTYVSAEKAAAIDSHLMSPKYGFCLPQLMELAGLSVAHAVADYTRGDTTLRLAIACGPGNNGGDGLVAARHLTHWGYAVSVVYPRRRDTAPFNGLLTQLQQLHVALPHELPDGVDLVVDAIFGFSFRGDGGVREPFAQLIAQLNAYTGRLLSVDVPSGWHVDEGNIYPEWAVRMPDALVSLTVPKLFARSIDNEGGDVVHYVGGRFVPPVLCRELAFEVPVYKGLDMIKRIS